MGARNQVISGDYVGKALMKKMAIEEPMLKEALKIHLSTKFRLFKLPIFEQVFINSETVQSYDVIHQESKEKMKGVSFGEGIGVFSGSIEKESVYTIAIQFKDGKRSVIEIDGEYYWYFLLGMKLWLLAEDVQDWEIVDQKEIEDEKIYRICIHFKDEMSDCFELDGKLYKYFLDKMGRYQQAEMLIAKRNRR